MKRPKTPFISLLLLPAMIAALNLLPVGRVTAQTFTTVHSFTASSTNSSGVYTNSEGARSVAGLILSGNTLYGTTSLGGSAGQGTVFKLNTDGTGFTNLHSFTDYSEGAYLLAGLVLSGSTLYGTAYEGGSFGNGTVFALNTDGTGFTNLHSFTATADNGNYSSTNSDGANPVAGLILSDNTLYGTASAGGSSSFGTVFAVNTNGTEFKTLRSFDFGDGASPQAGVILSGNSLYGTAQNTVFAVNTNGMSFRTLHTFGVGDGALPYGTLILSGNTLYGTAESGGSSGSGTVFAVNTNGTGFTTLHSFTAGGYNAFGAFTNSDGGYPDAGLVVSGNTLYGTAELGGSPGHGTVFAVNIDGTGFTNLHSFTTAANNGCAFCYTNSDGYFPQAGLILSGSTLYGTAQYGGSSGAGTVFSLSFRPQLTITPWGTNVILTWPTNVAGFDYTGYTLQSAPALTGPFTNLSAATNPSTNPITGPQQFYRLEQ